MTWVPKSDLLPPFSVCPQLRYRELPACAETQAMMHGRAHGWSLSLVSRESKLTPGAGFYRLRINHDEPSGQSNPGSIAGPFQGSSYHGRTTIDLKKFMSVETDGSGAGEEKRRSGRAHTAGGRPSRGARRLGGRCCQTICDTGPWGSSPHALVHVALPRLGDGHGH